MTNTLFTNDNLFVLHGLDSDMADLIYLDPPFNSKRMYAAPIGSKAAGAAFKDMWTWEDVNSAYLETLVSQYPGLAKFILSVQDVHSSAMAAYLAYMAQRLIECHRILKPTGSLYLHCDSSASHYLKLTLESIFRKDNFLNEIAWCYDTGATPKGKKLLSKHDTIFWFAKDIKALKTNELNYKHVIPAVDLKRYRQDEEGRFWRDNPVGDYTPESIKKLEQQGLIYYTKNGNPRIKMYLEKEGNGYYKYKKMSDFWVDIDALNANAAERTGYPTQKPLALLQRIIKASSNEGDLVLDPFCGCATTCVAAQQLHRRWIGIDIEKQASKILIERLADDAGMFRDFVHRTDIPKRTDISEVQITPGIKEKLFHQQKGICNGCSVGFEMRNFEVDHIIPRAKGGGDYYENFQLLCGSCNRIKGDRPMEYLMNRLNVIEAAHKRISFGD